MRFPENWLRAFCSPDWDSARIADQLTMAGLEVEEAVPVAPPFSGVVVAQVRSVEPHPDADKLRVCQVDVGDGSPRQIVCGAPNVAPGLKVPCALPGAVLPGGMAIKPVKMRGVASDGMLCSSRELGLSDEHAGLLVLDPEARVGEDIRAALALDEQVYTLKLTPNLAHCLGVYGVARELSALSGARLVRPKIEPVSAVISDKLPVKIQSPDLCGRFSGRIIRGVNARAATPAWMRSRLERAGQRSISALVDISNYVMLELGRPTHVFDLNKIHGGLVVRWGRAGESLELLNGQTVELDDQVGVIADDRQVESLAGIMGGEATAVSLDTTDIYVEAAFWWPSAIAGRSRRFNFSTDAGHRFERGVDPATTVEHIEYITRLILDVCGGQPGPVDDQVTGLPERRSVRMRPDRARKVIGAPVSDEEIATAFERLELPFVRDGADFVVTPPSFRFDLSIEEDLIEEVARIWGYQRLPVRPPVAAMPMRPAPEGRRPLLAIKRALAARDFQEVITYSFVATDLDASVSESSPIRLANPIAAQMDVMRTTLWGGLLETLRSNLNRKASRVRLFEAGRVFLADESAQAGPFAVAGVRQPMRLAALAYGPAREEQWSLPTRQVDFYDLKGDLESLMPGRLQCEAATHPALHPGRSARVLFDGVPAGWIGELHPGLMARFELARPPVLFEVDLEPMLSVRVPVYEPVSRFPPAIRDIAVVVDTGIAAGRIAAEIEAARREEPAAACIQHVRLFDEYRGKGLENKEKSLAFRIWMQDTRRTLSDAEAASAVEAIVARLADRFGARLR
jgi:phenylalanyl-tRNA synthetase beta chain